jgi:integrase
MAVRHAGERWLEAARAGRAVTRSGAPYRASTLSGYALALRQHVYPALGDRSLGEVTRGDVLALIGRLRTEGCAPASVRNAVTPLRVIFRYSNDHEWTLRNPTVRVQVAGLETARRERFPTPSEVRALLAGLEPQDRALWATAAYAGLRRGELMGLRCSDVDLAAGEIHVHQAYQVSARQMGSPKTASGARSVPISRALRPALEGQVRRAQAIGCELLFARGTLAGVNRGAQLPFADRAVARRAHAAWRAAGLVPVGLHEMRHAFASALIGAGAVLKVVSALMGHTSIRTTLDIYGHLLPHGRSDAIELLDRLLGEDEPGAAGTVRRLRAV